MEKQGKEQSIRSKVNEELSKTAITVGISGPLLYLAAKIWPDISKVVYGWLSSLFQPITLWRFIGIQLWVIIFLIFWGFGHRKRAKKLKVEFESSLKPHFGVLWDKDRNPYCPSCKILLHVTKDFNSEPQFHCIQCSKYMFIKDEAGQALSLSEARELLSTGSNIRRDKIVHFEGGTIRVRESTTMVQPGNNGNGKKLDKESEHLLVQISVNNILERDLIEVAGTNNKIATESKLHNLVKDNYLECIDQMGWGREYSLTHKAREYLLEHNLTGKLPMRNRYNDFA